MKKKKKIVFDGCERQWMRPEYKGWSLTKEDWMFQVGLEHLGVGATVLMAARTQAGRSQLEDARESCVRRRHAVAAVETDTEVRTHRGPSAF